MADRSVRRCAGASRAVVARRSNRLSSRPRSVLALIKPIRAAASSIASGMPSSALTTAATTATSSSSAGEYSGRTSRARSMKSCTASAAAGASPGASTGSGARSWIRSPTAPSRSRDVASSRASGAASFQRVTTSAISGAACSQLSRTSKIGPKAAIAHPSCETTLSSSPHERHAQRPRDAGHRSARVARFGQVTEPDAARARVVSRVQDGETFREARLAAPGRAEQSDESIAPSERLRERVKLPGAPPEGRR